MSKINKTSKKATKATTKKATRKSPTTRRVKSKKLSYSGNRSKLSPKAIDVIRNSDETLAKLAKKYHISAVYAGAIRNGLRLAS